MSGKIIEWLVWVVKISQFQNVYFRVRILAVLWTFQYWVYCPCSSLNSLFTWCSFALNLFIIVHFLVLVLHSIAQWEWGGNIYRNVFLKMHHKCMHRSLSSYYSSNKYFIHPLAACMLHNALLLSIYIYILGNLSAKKMFILLLNCVCMNVWRAGGGWCEKNCMQIEKSLKSFWDQALYDCSYPWKNFLLLLRRAIWKM